MTDSDWQALLDNDPADSTLRLQYSDWLEDQGLAVEAEVQRWLAQHKRQAWGCEGRRGHTWDWWNEEWPSSQPELQRAYVPRSVFQAMDGYVYRGPDYVEYGSRAEAEQNLARAWRKVKDAGRPLP